jgi:hypothetical protein
MTKISYKNAFERIAKEATGLKRLEDPRGGYYAEMTEAEFDELLERVINQSTKEFSNQLKYYSTKDELHFNIGEEYIKSYGGWIRTYRFVYLKVRFI